MINLFSMKNINKTLLIFSFVFIFFLNLAVTEKTYAVCQSINNIVETGEECDDGNTINDDGCTNACLFTFCGDNTIQNPNGVGVNEVCEDGNNTNDGICNASCTAPTFCGDNTTQTPNGAGLNEQCDPPDGTTCNALCLIPVCGNNYVDTGEECDVWPRINPFNIDTALCDWAGGSGDNACTNNTCGDNYLNDNEVCDASFTSNPFRGATCSSATAATLPQGDLTCNANCLGVDTSGCYECGNGLIEGPEVCDDENTGDDDGCSSSCVIESGWSCVGEPSVCTELCGNGIIDSGEVCDDGNRNHETTRDCPYGNPVCNFCNSNCSATINLTGSYCGDANVNYNAAYVCAGGANANNTCANDGDCPDSTCVQIEVCDLGAARNNDPLCDYSSTYPASPTCSLCLNNCKETGTANVSYCGDSIYDPSREDCDYAGAGCDACEIIPGYVCGNFGISPLNSYTCVFHCGVDADGNGSPLDEAYDINGDGNIDIDEQCDNGDNNGMVCSANYGETCSWCTNSCEPRTVVGDYCGDGEYNAANEACDDGNTVGNDGCSATCQIENGWQCQTTRSSVCQVVSGDGICVAPRENCINNINDCGLCSIGNILTAFPSKTTGVLNSLLQSITNIFPAPKLRINIPGLNLNKARINQDIEVEVSVPDGIKTPFFVGDEEHSLNIIPNAADPTKIDISFE